MIAVQCLRMAACASLVPIAAAASDVTVFAAASLKSALDAVAAAWMEETGNTARLSYAGSSLLAQQIRQGAPADVYISASTDWMDVLMKEGLIQTDTRRDLLGNSLVLIAHGQDHPLVVLGPETDLSAMLGDGKLAMALVDSVPAGIYGKAALTSLGLWPSVAPKVAQADNVRAALALVATAEAPLGIVYATDAAADNHVTVVATFPEASHPPIIYPIALTTSATSPVAADFLGFVESETAAAIFRAQGFRMVQ